MNRNISTWSNSTVYSFLLFFYNLLQLAFVKCSPLFPCIESAVPAFKDIRAVVARPSWQRARATWIPDQWLDRESVHRHVRRSENSLWSWWIKLFRIYVLEHRQIWYERHSTQKDLSFLSMHSTWVDLLLAFNSSMISVCNIFVAHPPRDFKRFWNLTLAALGTKKQQEGQIWIGLHQTVPLLAPLATIGADGCCCCSMRPFVPSVCLSISPSVHPEQWHYLSNSVRISAISLKFGGLIHSTMKQIAL